MLPDASAVIIADTKNNRIRKLSLTTLSVTTLAGGGNYWLPSDGVGWPVRSFSIPSQKTRTHSM